MRSSGLRLPGILGLIDKHNGNTFANRISTTAGSADDFFLFQNYVGLARWACQFIQKLLIHVCLFSIRLLVLVQLGQRETYFRTSWSVAEKVFIVKPIFHKHSGGIRYRIRHECDRQKKQAGRSRPAPAPPTFKAAVMRPIPAPLSDIRPKTRAENAFAGLRRHSPLANNCKYLRALSFIAGSASAIETTLRHAATASPVILLRA